jgi:hypothetical protein
MQLHKTMERSASALCAFLLLACGARDNTADTGADPDSADAPLDDLGTPADMGVPKTEWEGLRVGKAYPDPIKATFTDCETGVERRLAWSIDPESPWTGTCDGMYYRFRGVADDTSDPPILFIEEILEARWCRPDDCGGCEPDFDSCYQEAEKTKCDPLAGVLPQCSPSAQCRPTRFTATESAAWWLHTCVGPTGDLGHGEHCEYPTDLGYTGIIDTCADGLRCWNPNGTLDAGTCVPYCDPKGVEGNPCEGECIQCSSSERGLCVTGCSGDDCHVEEFC